MLTIFTPTGLYNAKLFQGYFLGSVQLLTAASGSYVPPAKCRVIVIYAIGAGGVGSAVTGAAGQLNVSAGGGGGGLAVKMIANLTGAGYTYTISTALSQVVDGSGNIVCDARAGANAAATGSGTTQVFIAGPAGAPITNEVGDFVFAGCAGEACFRNSATVGKAGGGAPGPFGGGTISRISQGAGANGGNYGAGSGGGYSVNGGGGANGGTRGPGAIIIWEYY